MPDRDLENNLLTSDKWEVFKNITNLSAGVNGVYGLLMTLQSTGVPFDYNNRHLKFRTWFVIVYKRNKRIEKGPIDKSLR